jgi:membrane protein DedA with SNARE-associated domain
MEHFVVTQISHHGYLAVLTLMILESACIPIPSEAVMLFGGALAGGLTVAGMHVHLNVVVVASAGAAGNLLGSLIAYAVGRWGGRTAIERWGGRVLVRPHDLDRAEAFFVRRGDLAVLIGRLVPVVRTFISLPAGIAQVPPVRFALLTVAGSLPWTFALALIGDAVASNWKSIESDFTIATVVIAAIAAAAILRWLLFRPTSTTDDPVTTSRTDSTTQPVPE